MLAFALNHPLPEFDLDVALEVGRETVVLIGRSGCGKSTTLAILAGLMTPAHGRVELDGDTVFSTSARVDTVPERRRLGYLFQQYALFPHLRARDNIIFGLRRETKTERRRRLDEVAELLGIARFLDAYPEELSGGERQRVALARAIVTRPRALLLDEPLAALDVANRARIRLELRALLERLAIPTIVVSHDFEDARVLADRIAVMEHGRIVQLDTPSNLARRPANAFVAQFVGTNFATVQLDGATVCAAFDPWSVRLTRNGEKEEAFAWHGAVVDVAHVGPFVRVHVDAATSLLADVPLAKVAAPFRIGDRVVVSVPRGALRIIGDAAA